MRRSLKKDQFAEVRVDGDEDAFFRGSPLEQHTIPGIGSAFPGFDHVVPFRSKPVGEPSTGTAIDQEFHFVATRTASRES